MGNMPTLVGRSPTADRLLALLTSTPGQEFHTRDLVRRIRGSVRPVQRALVRLEADGLIESRRVGNLRLWRMDPAHPLYAPLRQIYARTVGVGARLAETLRKQPDVELAFIFGSYARAQDDATSDIDVFVLGNIDWKFVATERERLSEELRREIKEIVWTDEDLRKRIEMHSPFLEELRTTAKIWIVGSDSEFEQRLGDLAAAVPRGGPEGGAEHQRRAPEAGRRGQKSRPRASAARRRR